MKYLKMYVIPAFIIVIAVLFFSLFRRVPSGKLWNGYSVFFIEQQADDALVSNTLSSFGCSGIISSNGQVIPVELSKDSPEISLLFSGLEKSDYLYLRNNYFFDKSREYKVFYVPDQYSSELSDAADYLQNEKNFSCGVDASSSFPLIPVILVVIFSIVLVIKSEKRILFILSAILPVYFSFMMPYYSGLACVCLVMLLISVSLKMWNRTGGLKRLLKIRILQILLGVSVITAFLTGVVNGLLFVLLLMAEVSIFHFYKILEENNLKKFSFRPVQIRSAKMISLISKKSVFCMLSCAGAIFLILVSSFFSVTVGTSGSGKSLMLPSEHGSGSLPGLEEYSKWRWETLTFPYVSVNSDMDVSNPKNGDTVTFSMYNDNPEAVEEIVNTMTYDDSFITKSLEVIDSLPDSSVERLIKSRGKNFSAGYTASGSQNVTIFTIILLIITLFVPVTFYLLCFKKVRKA